MIRANDRLLSSVQSTTASYHVIINATDACGLQTDNSARLIVNAISPAASASAGDAMPTFTATVYSFSISHLATPGHVIGYLNLSSGMLATGHYKMRRRSGSADEIAIGQF